nr:deoxyribodipyrimidine photo-lyase [Atribacterota bacterium]
MIQEDRISYLNDKKEQKGKYLVYWMQASQRVKYNHALETALRIANKRSLPLLVYFEINTNYPDANLRHYYFMLEGLQEVKQQLNKMGIKMIIGFQNNKSYPDLTYLAQEAAMVITDCGYLRFQTEWREKYAQKLPCPLVQVETDVIVPVESASGKEEINIASFRKKMLRLLVDYLDPLKTSDSVRSSLDFKFTSFGIDDI